MALDAQIERADSGSWRGDVKELAQGQRVHVYNDFPHIASHNGNCLCKDKCCLGEDGCICRTCAHVGHEAGKIVRRARRQEKTSAKEPSVVNSWNS